MKPNFSGEWILNRQACTLAPGADAIQSGVWHIDHQDPRFRHQAEFVPASGPPIRYEYELRADGREAAWDGAALVVTMRRELPHGTMVIVFRFELTMGGRTLTAFEQLRGTDHDQDNTWIFDRA